MEETLKYKKANECYIEGSSETSPCFLIQEKRDIQLNEKVRNYLPISFNLTMELIATRDC